MNNLACRENYIPKGIVPVTDTGYATKERDVPEIPRLLDQIDKSVEGLKDVLNELQARLAVVLTGPVSEGPCEPRANAQTPLGDRLLSLRETTEAMRRFTGNLASAVQL